MNRPAVAHFADQALQQVVTVERNIRIARDTYRLRFHCPEMACRILPGQFLMLRLTRGHDPLLGRPLALYDAVLAAPGRPESIDVVYLVVGKMTRRLAAIKPGQDLDVWGPLGNGFRLPPVQQLIMVAGGIGQTPFLSLARECLGQQRYGAPPRHTATVSRVALCYGVQTADLLAGIDDFRQAGVDVHIATDDGSQAHHGPVTDLLEQVLPPRDRTCHVVCCGPKPMMQSVARITSEAGIPCQVSLETPMACGMGICFSCVAKVRDARGQWDYRRACVEGPVFDATDVVW